MEVLDSPEAARRAPSPASNLGAFHQVPAVAELTAPVVRGIRSKAITVETLRKSDRVAKEVDGQMMDRAVRLTAEKNASAAKTGNSGKNLDPIFAILQDLPDSHLLSVASDSCVFPHLWLARQRKPSHLFAPMSLHRPLWPKPEIRLSRTWPKQKPKIMPLSASKRSKLADL